MSLLVRLMDPIFTYAVPLAKSESDSTGKVCLVEPEGYNKGTICTHLSDLIARRPPVTVTDSEDDEQDDDVDVDDGEQVRDDTSCDQQFKHASKQQRHKATRSSTRKRRHSAKMQVNIETECEQFAVDVTAALPTETDAEPTVNGKVAKADEAVEPVHAASKQRKTSKPATVSRRKSARKGARSSTRLTRGTVCQSPEDLAIEEDKESLQLALENNCFMKVETKSDVSDSSPTKAIKSDASDSSPIKQTKGDVSDSLPTKQTKSDASDSSPKQTKSDVSDSSPHKQQTSVASNNVKLNFSCSMTDEKDATNIESNSVQTPTGTNDDDQDSETDKKDGEIARLLNSSSWHTPVTTAAVASERDEAARERRRSAPQPASSTESQLIHALLQHSNQNPSDVSESSVTSLKQLSEAHAASSSSVSRGTAKPVVARKKSLNSLLEKVQSRQQSALEPSVSAAGVVPVATQHSTGARSPRKIKDLLAESDGLLHSQPPPTAAMRNNQQAPAGSHAAPTTSASSAAAAGRRVVCVNGCDGYEPGEVHSHSPDHVSVDSASLMGIPNLDINQVWAATYSACFMASYQALQAKVLQQQAQQQTPEDVTSSQQISQPDLLNLASDVSFQAQLLTQFQQNLLRSMSGVVRADQQAQVLAKTQQVLMQNIAVMQKAQKSADYASSSASSLSPRETSQSDSLSSSQGKSTMNALLNSAYGLPAVPNPTAPSSGGNNAPASTAQAHQSRRLSSPRALVSPASSTSSSEVNVITSSSTNNSGGTVAARGAVMYSPSSSPVPRSNSLSPGSRSRLSRGVCGPRNKHKKKWWEVEPSDEVSSIVNKHLQNIKKAAEERSQVRQEIERSTHLLSDQTPQRCKRRSVDSQNSGDSSLQARSSKQLVGGATAALSGDVRSAGVKASARALISSSQRRRSYDVASSSQRNTEQAEVLDLTRSPTPDDDVIVAATSHIGSEDVISVEPEAPEDSAEWQQHNSHSQPEVTNDQSPVSAPAVMPGWFGKGWRCNKSGRRKKSR